MLWRRWESGKPYALFIGLNPSTADEVQDDPTIRRCIGYAKRWGYGAYVMANIFAYRATDPKVMMRKDDPIGPYNDAWITRMAEGAGVIVCAWGAHGEYMRRGDEVKRLLFGRDLMCLGKTKNGQPKHPLYLKADQPLEVLQELPF